MMIVEFVGGSVKRMQINGLQESLCIPPPAVRERGIFANLRIRTGMLLPAARRKKIGGFGHACEEIPERKSGLILIDTLLKMARSPLSFSF